jgi:sec-independent protein translocase protein TatB
LFSLAGEAQGAQAARFNLRFPMFDIGFWELALIGVVALLVVGPDRLPGLARTVGLWVGRIRRYVSTVRDDIEREIQADELKKMLDKPDELSSLQDIVDETTSTISDAKREFAGVDKDAEELMSGETIDPPGASDTLGSDDETGVDRVTPQAAATAIGEAVSARVEVPAQAPAETTDEAAQDTESDERRSR